MAYYDRNGVEISVGDWVRFFDGTVKKLWESDDGRLCTDATSESWIFSMRAYPCQYGLYPVEEDEFADCEVLVNPHVMADKLAKKAAERGNEYAVKFLQFVGDEIFNSHDEWEELMEKYSC